MALPGILAVAAKAIPKALPFAASLAGKLLGKRKKTPSFEYPRYEETEPAWLKQLREQYLPAITAPATYTPVSQDVVDYLLKDIREGTEKAGQIAIGNVMRRGFRPKVEETSFLGSILSDVAKEGLTKEQRLLSEIAEINAQRKAQAERERLNRIANFLTSMERLSRGMYEYPYTAALLSYKARLAEPEEDWSDIGKLLSNAMTEIVKSKGWRGNLLTESLGRIGRRSPFTQWRR